MFCIIINIDLLASFSRSSLLINVKVFVLLIALHLAPLLSLRSLVNTHVLAIHRIMHINDEIDSQYRLLPLRL